jgi:hypothetical protein
MSVNYYKSARVTFIYTLRLSTTGIVQRRVYNDGGGGGAGGGGEEVERTLS